jgi:hypothetical protein
VFGFLSFRIERPVTYLESWLRIEIARYAQGEAGSLHAFQRLHSIEN